MIKLPSGSQLNRVELCPGSAALPQYPNAGNEYSNFGTAGHAFLDAALDPKRGRDVALEAAPEASRELFRAIDLEALPPEARAARGEMLIAWEPDTGKVASFAEDERSKLDLTRTVVARADVVAVTADKSLVFVGDWKFGRRAVPSAEENLQVLVPAFAAARLYGATGARTQIVYVRADDEPFVSTADHDAIGLHQAEQRALKLVKAARAAGELVAQGKEPPLLMGDHCLWCPAFNSCPAQIRLLNALAHDPEKVLAEEVEKPLEAGAGAVAYRKLRAIELALKKADAKLDAYAHGNPIDLGNGKVYGPVTMGREKVEPLTAYAVLSEGFNKAVAEAAVPSNPETSKAAIERALRPVAKETGEPFKAIFEQTLAEIEKRGGITTKSYEVMKEHKLAKGT